MNVLTIVGRVTRDAEIVFTPNGKSRCKFSVAVDQRGKKSGDTDKTDFFDCEAWEKAAEFAAQWVKKGECVAVSGRFESRKHDGKTYWTLKAEQVNPFLGGSKRNEEAPAPRQAASETDENGIPF